MTPAEKGERYARIFRKAGTFLAKGNIARAIEVFKQGLELARINQDIRMGERFQSEIDRAQASLKDPEK
jgi:hypothetical protein